MPLCAHKGNCEMHTTILYHKKCNDGLIAALNYYAYFKEKDELEHVTFQPVQYGEGLPDESILKDRHVYIVDFSYSSQEMARLIELSEKTVLLDHHESAIHNLFTGQKWFTQENHRYVNEADGMYLLNSAKSSISINKQKSGATLAYSEVGQCIQDDRVKVTLEYLSKRAEDRDNWVFAYEDSKAVHEHVRSFGFDLAKLYDELLGDGKTIEDLFYKVKESQIRVDMRDELARNYARLAKPIEFMGHTVPAVNVPSDFASIVGDILNKDVPFAVMYVVTDQKILVSLRSSKNKGVDVQAIASKMGGGGHVNASGTSIR